MSDASSSNPKNLKVGPCLDVVTKASRPAASATPRESVPHSVLWGISGDGGRMEGQLLASSGG